MKGKKVFVLVSILLVGVAARSATSGEPREHRRKLADHGYLCIQSLENMRAVQTAIDAYAVDHPTYPRVNTMEELRSMVEPAYIAKTPMSDGWGTPLRYVASPDGQHYWLVSAGSDRVFDEKSWASPAFLSDSRSDAVLSSGGWDTEREWVIQE